MKIIKIKMFGAFKNYISSGKIEVQINEYDTVSTLKDKIILKIKEDANHFQNELLVFESALSNEEEILDLDSNIYNQTELALLPPVCGG